MEKNKTDEKFLGRTLAFLEKVIVLMATTFVAQIAYWSSFFLSDHPMHQMATIMCVVGLVVNIIFLIAIFWGYIKLSFRLRRIENA